MVVDTMDLEACHSIYSQWYQHDRGQEGEAHSRGGRGRGPFMAGDVLVMVAEIPSDLPVDHGIHEQPTTVSMANAAIRSGFSSHTGLMAAGFLIQRKPGATVICCS